MSKKQNDFLKECLPFDEPRTQQIEALKFIQESDKRFIVLEMPTGSGKSWVAFWAVNLWLSAFKKECEWRTEDEIYRQDSSNKYSSFILTSQKILQDQYQQ